MTAEEVREPPDDTGDDDTAESLALLIEVHALGWKTRFENGRWLISPPPHIIKRIPKMVEDFQDFGLLTILALYEFTQSAEQMPVHWRAAPDPVPTLRQFITPVAMTARSPTVNVDEIENLIEFHRVKATVIDGDEERYRRTVDALKAFQGMVAATQRKPAVVVLRSVE